MGNVERTKDVVAMFGPYLKSKFGPDINCDIKKIKVTGNENIYSITWLLENSILIKTNAFISKSVIGNKEEIKISYAEDTLINTRVEYLYRDASNYKMYNSEVVFGFIPKSDQEKIKKCLIDGEYFIPRMVGLRENRCDDLYTEDDHDYFELIGFNYTLEDPTVNILSWELVKKFQNVDFEAPIDKEVFIQKFYDFLKQPTEITRVFIRKGTQVYMVEGGTDPWNWYFDIKEEDIENFSTLLENIMDIPIYQTNGGGAGNFDNVKEAILDIAGCDSELLKDFLIAFADENTKKHVGRKGGKDGRKD